MYINKYVRCIFADINGIPILIFLPLIGQKYLAGRQEKQQCARGMSRNMSMRMPLKSEDMLMCMPDFPDQ